MYKTIYTVFTVLLFTTQSQLIPMCIICIWFQTFQKQTSKKKIPNNNSSKTFFNIYIRTVDGTVDLET